MAKAYKPGDAGQRGEQSIEEWLRKRRENEGAEGLWRIHDTIYDLTDFAARHPGGRTWIDMTRGLDITEAVEVHVNHDAVVKLMAKYAVRKAKTPSASLHTFSDDGFYATLRRRVWDVLKTQPSGPAAETCRVADASLAAFICAFAAMAYYRSYLLAAVAGVLVALVQGAAHNFFHQRDNFRAYYFDLGLFRMQDWRYSHALSHHLFTNTLLDLEVTEYNPFILYLPFQTRNFVQREVSRFYVIVMNLTTTLISFVKRLGRFATGQAVPYLGDSLVFVELAVLVAACGGREGTLLWLAMHMACSFFFTSASLVAGTHHNDKIWHQGDFVRDRDFGLMQLEATRDRWGTVDGNVFAVWMFGDHCLHHLFPLVDAARLPGLYPVFRQTCDDFGLKDVNVMRISFAQAARGFFRQIRREERWTSSTVASAS